MTDAPKVEGGFDGLVLSFGEGCDIDTINTLLPAWRVELTMKDGRKIESEIVGAGSGEDNEGDFIEYHPVDDADEVIPFDIHTVPFEDVVGIHIY